MMDGEVVPFLSLWNNWITEHKTVVEQTASLQGLQTETFIKLMLDDAIDAWANSVLCNAGK